MAYWRNVDVAPGAAPSHARVLAALALVVVGAVTASAPARADGYRVLPVRGPGTVSRLRAELGEERFTVLLAVNRVDAVHAGRVDSLLLPPAGRSRLELSPFPRVLAAVDTLSTLVLVSPRIQAFAAYDSGRLVRWGPISSGGPASPTTPGSYRANWKARRHVSTFDSTWVMPWSVNLDDRVGTAMHAYALPGMPASHCCIRLLESDARWVYDWIEVPTTPVIVLDAYDFEAPRPWRRLAADPAACDLTGSDVEPVLRAIGLARGAAPVRGGAHK